MVVWDWLKTRWQSEAVHYTYFWIPEGNIEMPAGEKPNTAQVTAGQHYYKIWLADMFLKNDREWGSTWCPAVMASVQLKFGSKTQELTHVAGESTLKNFDRRAVRKGVSLNHEITDLLPFNGGTVRLEAALLAMEGKNGAKSLLKVLGDFSKLLVVPQLSSALAVAAPLASGILELVGATDAHPELRMEDTWTGTGVGSANILRAGYFVMISAEAGNIDPKDLFVRGSRLYRGADELTGYHYMLFRVDTTDSRDDWDALSSISEPYAQAVEMLQSLVGQDDEEIKKKLKAEAEKRFGAARLAAIRAPELTNVVGRNQVLTSLDQRWAEAKKQIGVQNALPTNFPATLKAAMRNPISVQAALDMGERSEQDWLE
jgi:hypothetical protein